MKPYRLIISAIFVLAVVVRLVCFVGLIGSDDLNYNRYAYALSQGTFTPQPNQHATRLGLTLPVSFIFRVMGVNEMSSILFPFLCFMLTFIVLIATATTYFDRWTGIMAGVLYALLPIDIFHATQLLPDLPSAAFIALSAALFYRIEVRTRSESPCSRIHAGSVMFLAGMTLGWAYLIKETAIFFAVFLCGYMVYHIVSRRAFPRSWIWFGVGVLIMLGAEMGYYAWSTGTPFYRYLSVQTGHNLSLFSGEHFQGGGLLRRLLLDQLRVLFDLRYFGVAYFFILAGVVFGLLRPKPDIRYIIGWFLAMFCLLNFGSTSLSSYAPLLLFHRFFLLLSAPGILIMAWYFRQIAAVLSFTSKQELRALRLSLLIPFLLMLLIHLIWFAYLPVLFLGFMLIVLGIAWSRRFYDWFRGQISPQSAPLIFPVLFLSLSVLPGIQSVLTRERPLQGITCERMIRPALEFPLVHPIYTDVRTEAILEYFYQYQYNEMLKNFDEAAPETWKEAYVVLNPGRLLFLNRLYHTPIPAFVNRPPATWQLYARLGDETNICTIYMIP